MGMLQKRTRRLLVLGSTERHDPDMHVTEIRPLRTIRDGLSVGKPVAWEFRTLRVDNSPRSSTVQRLTQEAHTPIVTSAKKDFTAIWRPGVSEFGLRNTSVGKTKNHTFAQQIHHPDRGENSVRVVKPVNHYMPLIWRKTKRKIIVTRADFCHQLALPIEPGELVIPGAAILIQQNPVFRN